MIGEGDGRNIYFIYFLFQREPRMFVKPLIALKYGWSIFLLYLYTVYKSFMERVAVL